LRLALLFAAVIYLTSLISPPRLMDDFDAAQAQMARNMVDSGDWVTPRLNGVADFEKPAGEYWLIAASYRIFGVHDWAARIPTSLAAMLICWLVAGAARRSIGPDAGLYTGLALSTSLGLWLFTRTLIPDIGVTAAVACAILAFHRALETPAPASRKWALAGWIAAAAGVLIKGLIAAVFPFGAIALYLLFGGFWRDRDSLRRLHIPLGALLYIVLTVPWFVLATLRNPPYFDFTLHSGPGQYHGFFWFLFFNEHILRFFNLRYPHDYGQVPRLAFWLLHLAWLFPWSIFLFRAGRMKYRAPDSASRLRLLALCWAGTVLVFFTLATRQEYYSMPAYPALAILIGAAMAEAGDQVWRRITLAVSAIATLALVSIAAILAASARYSAPGDIAQALAQNPAAYTLSLGHMGDLTLRSFAYLRGPLILAGIATLAGALGAFVFRRKRAALAIACMMVLFLQAAHLALIAFDPYMGSFPLADALNKAPRGGLIVDDPYFEFSSLFFYTHRQALILNGRVNNLEYGSYAPGAPHVFIGDQEFIRRWKSPDRWYVATEDDKAQHLRDLVGNDLRPIVHAGGKTIYVNQ
jgi:4-amino-4-deoxy-L-arabinose transferase-like glycosyltransferase